MEDKASMRKITIIFVVMAIFVTGCAKKEAPRPKDEPKKEKAAENQSDQNVHQKILSFNLEGLNEKGAKKWEVKGESAEAVSQDEIKMNNITAKAYGEEAEATITADRGTYDKSKNNVRLEENVKAVIENTQAFAGSRMNLPEEVIAKSGVKESEQDKKAKSKTVIVCDEEAVFDYEKNLAYFNKNVKVRSSDGDIDADRITVNLDKESKKIRDIIAEGNVKIQKGENTTYSDKATYTEADKKVILSGNPKIVIYQEGNVAEKFLK